MATAAEQNQLSVLNLDLEMGTGKDWQSNSKGAGPNFAAIEPPSKNEVLSMSIDDLIESPNIFIVLWALRLHDKDVLQHMKGYIRVLITASIAVVIPFFISHQLWPDPNTDEDEGATSVCPNNVFTDDLSFVEVTTKFSGTTLAMYSIANSLASLGEITGMMYFAYINQELLSEFSFYDYLIPFGILVQLTSVVFVSLDTYLLFIDASDVSDLLLNSLALNFVLDADKFMGGLQLSDKITASRVLRSYSDFANDSSTKGKGTHHDAFLDHFSKNYPPMTYKQISAPLVKGLPELVVRMAMVTAALSTFVSLGFVFVCL